LKYSLFNFEVVEVVKLKIVYYIMKAVIRANLSFQSNQFKFDNDYNVSKVCLVLEGNSYLDLKVY
jgi:hypothetical protein